MNVVMADEWIEHPWSASIAVEDLRQVIDPGPRFFDIRPTLTRVSSPVRVRVIDWENSGSSRRHVRVLSPTVTSKRREIPRSSK
jgi:hypothetical protein